MAYGMARKRQLGQAQGRPKLSPEEAAAEGGFIGDSSGAQTKRHQKLRKIRREQGYKY